MIVEDTITDSGTVVNYWLGSESSVEMEKPNSTPTNYLKLLPYFCPVRNKLPVDDTVMKRNAEYLHKT